MTSTYHNILKQFWGFATFRPLQEEIIRSVADFEKDTLGLLPTGGGKSIIFQVPALAKEGLCLVITPLIALMNDQVNNLKHKGIKAAAVHSGMSKNEIEVTLRDCINGNYKFLYLSPERLDTESFIKLLPSLKINFLVVDEAHCISQWGYDFRPPYLRIAEVRRYLPKNIPVLALTATATTDVVNDIQEKLKFREKNVFQKSFKRDNLIYLVRNVEDKLGYLLKIVQKMNGSGLVYMRSRKGTVEVSDFLRKNNVSADFFHANLESKVKEIKQNQWKAGHCRIMVATNAFGMGIDKPDVRFVVHLDLPESLESYFQEAGRGGRDEKISYAVILYNEEDVKNLESTIDTAFPDISEIKAIYSALGNYFQLPIGAGKGQSFPFYPSEFTQRYRIPIARVQSCLKFLEREGYIQATDIVNSPSRIHYLVDGEELYKFQVSHPHLDGFIKFLQRNYSGTFTEYVKIDEEFLANRGGVTKDTVIKYLTKLKEYGILDYISQRESPYIVYTEERLDEKSLRISREHYFERKNVFLKKLQSVISYVSLKNHCRSEILLNYFGEKNTSPCGNCDVCKEKDEQKLSTFEFETIVQQIQNILLKESQTIELLTNILDFPKPKILKVTQWLLETEKIIPIENNKVQWNAKK